MGYDDGFLDKKLNERIEGNFLRRLTLSSGLIDFCSNDYLGIATNHLINNSFTGREAHGSKGARTLAGNYTLIEFTEAGIAQFHRAEAALIFNSGYNANTGLLSAVAQRGDVIYYDALSHASIRDGVRLSFAESFSFRHNDVNDLEEKLRSRNAFSGQIFVVTESVFSMDGDIAPISELISVCMKYGAHLIVDEAHAIGVIGDNGEGVVQSLGRENEVFARVYTYGKAPGCHGAAIAGSTKLKSYLINFSRSFVYTTALPESAVKAISEAYSIFPVLKTERKHLSEMICLFQSADMGFEKLKSTTPVQGVIVPGNSEVKKLATRLQENSLDVRPILYPSVPKGKERLRISIHSFNTKEQVKALIGWL
ncbi:pyridoxal phosphate-dependent aminotransferase family protein [Pollutibacter soli]|uniref:aminotransferase class I/II-fold pyridoxal phosphate-dependent enzyme n=1 Tax=Pollutibacter soli TaxID=3034157 RepID=UPI00301355E1